MNNQKKIYEYHTSSVIKIPSDDLTVASWNMLHDNKAFKGIPFSTVAIILPVITHNMHLLPSYNIIIVQIPGIMEMARTLFIFWCGWVLSDFTHIF